MSYRDRNDARRRSREAVKSALLRRFNLIIRQRYPQPKVAALIATLMTNPVWPMLRGGQ